MATSTLIQPTLLAFLGIIKINKTRENFHLTMVSSDYDTKGPGVHFLITPREAKYKLYKMRKESFMGTKKDTPFGKP